MNSSKVAGIAKLRSLLLSEIGSDSAANALFTMIADVGLPKEVVRELARKLDRHADAMERDADDRG